MASTTDLKSQSIGFIGGGNMAQAIGISLIKRGFLDPTKVWVSARTNNTLKIWKKLGVNTTLENSLVALNCSILILAVKPQFLDDVAEDLELVPDSTVNLIISVIVGVTISTLTNKFSKLLHRAKLVRTMPNTPLFVGEGITVYATDGHIDQTYENYVSEIFSKIGIVEKIDEKMIDSAGSLSGCGPAFVYLMIEALADGAVKKGVPRAMANKLAAQVMIGAGKMVLETGKHPGQLKDEVCSPGGSTIVGMHALESGAVRASLINAVEAAANKSAEFGS